MDRPAPPPLPRLDPTDPRGNVFARIIQAASKARQDRYAYFQGYRDEHRARAVEPEGKAPAE